MSRENQTVWTCDRCGKRTATSVDREPLVWGGSVVASLPGMNNERIDLCNPCEVSLRHYLKMDPAWALADRFFLAAADYFDQPTGAAGNKARADKARTLLGLLTLCEDDVQAFWETGAYVGKPKDWPAEPFAAPSPSTEEQHPS